MDSTRNVSNCGEVVVLTGSTGCLGHSTLRLLISRDEFVREIRCLDLVEPEDYMKKSIEEDQFNLEKRLGHRKCVKFIHGDIRDICTVERTLEGADCIIHCAAKIDVWVDPHDQDVGQLQSINVNGTENLLKSAIKLGVSRFVHVSSFETFVGIYENYNATENGIILTDSLLFGASGTSKREADNLVMQYSGRKLSQPNTRFNEDSLIVVLIKSTFIYGEHDKYFVSRFMKMAKFFGGTLQRYTNYWIRHQPIYVGNAAWALIKAKQQMAVDQSVSGEQFFISDDTPVCNPFRFLRPFLETRGMKVSESTRSGPITLLYLLIFFRLKRLATRLATSVDCLLGRLALGGESGGQQSSQPTRWFHLVKPQMFLYMLNTLYLERTKASVRLNYEPLFDAKESMERSIKWYRDQLIL